MAIPFNGNASQSEEAKKSKAIIDKAVIIAAKFRDELDLDTLKREIPDEAIMLALFDDLDVQEFMDSIRGLNKKTLKGVMEQYCREALADDSLTRSRKYEVENRFVDRLTKDAQWDLKHVGGDNFDPVHLFIALLSDKLRPTNPHFAYDTAGISDEKLGRAQRSWSLERQPSQENAFPKKDFE